ncbi:DUF2157 domain-containing protein [uncultured Demequina sp.]|uniref:DUF2157 domain-containing protein n=1 Tax=uncultured Demequina sp. TaxID=693499 RepID=UPI0025CD6D7C|nr:DUF2157 domain-containing protein [uncultured Demequina sp.]
MDDLDDRIDRWVVAGIISPATGDALRAHENEDTPRSGEDPTRPFDDEGPRPLAVVGEIVGYVGAILILWSAAFLLSSTWTQLGDGARIALVAALAATITLAGILASRSPHAPAQRLASVLLAGSVALAAWLAWLVADGTSWGEEVIAVVTAGAATAAAAAIYLGRRRGLAQLALLTSLTALCLAAVAAAVDIDTMAGALAMGLAPLALGCAWVALAASWRLPPPTAGLIAGGLVAGLVPLAATSEPARGIGVAAAVAASAGFIVLSLTRRPLASLMIPGGLGLLAGLPTLIDHLADDEVATLAGVLIAGLGLVAASVWMLRRRAR